MPTTVEQLAQNKSAILGEVERIRDERCGTGVSGTTLCAFLTELRDRVEQADPISLPPAETVKNAGPKIVEGLEAQAGFARNFHERMTHTRKTHQMAARLMEPTLKRLRQLPPDTNAILTGFHNFDSSRLSGYGIPLVREKEKERL